MRIADQSFLLNSQLVKIKKELLGFLFDESVKPLGSIAVGLHACGELTEIALSVLETLISRSNFGTNLNIKKTKWKNRLVS